MTYITENTIVKLQKLYRPPRNLRVGNKLPALFLKELICTGDLSPARIIFIERPVVYIYYITYIIYACVYIILWMYVYIYILCISVYVYYVYMCVWVCLYIYISIYISISISISIYLSIYIYIYIYFECLLY